MRRESPAATITAGRAPMPAASSGGGAAGEEERGEREAARQGPPESPRVGERRWHQWGGPVSPLPQVEFFYAAIFVRRNALFPDK